MWQRAISLLNQPFYNGPAFHGERFRKRRLVGSRQNGAMGAPLSPEGQRAGVCRVQRDGRGGAERRRGIEPLDGVSTRISPGRRALLTGYRRSV